MKNIGLLRILVSVVVLVSPIALGRIIYVDDDASGANDGTCWHHAHHFLQDALAHANSGDEIRIAQGAYCPHEGRYVNLENPREATFQLVDGVTIRGGYAGADVNGVDSDARDIDRFKTILSGDLLDNDHVNIQDPCELLTHESRQDNSYHIILVQNVSHTSILDGVIIKGGNANGLGNEQLGGGLVSIASSLRLVNCTLVSNSAIVAGGLYNYLGFLTMTECTFSHCYAEAYAGALINDEALSHLTQCQFLNNEASSSGGAVFNDTHSENSPLFENCRFEACIANRGGAIYNKRTDGEITFCDFERNHSNQGGGAIYNERSDPVISNCAFISNSAGSFAGDTDFGQSEVLERGFSPPLIYKFAEGHGPDGGAIYNFKCGSTLLNCVFALNSAQNLGGALYTLAPDFQSGNITITDYVDFDLINCTFYSNFATWGGHVQ